MAHIMHFTTSSEGRAILFAPATTQSSALCCVSAMCVFNFRLDSSPDRLFFYTVLLTRLILSLHASSERGIAPDAILLPRKKPSTSRSFDLNISIPGSSSRRSSNDDKFLGWGGMEVVVGEGGGDRLWVAYVTLSRSSRRYRLRLAWCSRMDCPSGLRPYRTAALRARRTWNEMTVTRRRR
ncbi:hypothetical protein C8R45DRAFT_975847 [Mycena sanguinolenta]|nr:hypothetical protein C8R45DRAFT_975847 [Mycena sanguinolenta]